jgi:hypothetical protein
MQEVNDLALETFHAVNRGAASTPVEMPYFWERAVKDAWLRNQRWVIVILLH